MLSFDNFTVLAITNPVGLQDRALYWANGLEPRDFDLTVVKCPHTEYQMFDAWAAKNFNIDAPGATSANLPTLGHTICARPIYPLELDTGFTAAPKTYRRSRAG